MTALPSTPRGGSMHRVGRGFSAWACAYTVAAGLAACGSERGASAAGDATDGVREERATAESTEAGGAGDDSARLLGPECTPPLLFGHRGTILFAPENTLPAYEYAVDSGGDGIEVDLRITADGALVAMHDASLARTTDAGELLLRDVPLVGLSAFDAGAWFAPEFTGTRIPSLETVLERFAPESTRFLFDLKEAEAVAPLAVAVRERDLASRSIVSSTSLEVLRQFHELIPETAALYYPPSLDVLDAIDVPSVRYVRVPKDIQEDPANVRRVREAGYEAAVSGRLVQWDGEDTEFTALGLVNNMELTAERRQNRRPTECGAN